MQLSALLQGVTKETRDVKGMSKTTFRAFVPDQPSVGGFETRAQAQADVDAACGTKVAGGSIAGAGCASKGGITGDAAVSSSAGSNERDSRCQGDEQNYFQGIRSYQPSVGGFETRAQAQADVDAACGTKVAGGSIAGAGCASKGGITGDAAVSSSAGDAVVVVAASFSAKGAESAAASSSGSGAIGGKTQVKVEILGDPAGSAASGGDAASGDSAESTSKRPRNVPCTERPGFSGLTKQYYCCRVCAAAKTPDDRGSICHFCQNTMKRLKRRTLDDLGDPDYCVQVREQSLKARELAGQSQENLNVLKTQAALIVDELVRRMNFPAGESV
eukprot:CAMPEP_0115507870 /NCGR_PEP_ID=MMETSP0271-20121206/71981_1 /TAXON_ID=71861 /ORGANISM="Scrippsiella trochoidea, Strain CCMP3099" /LENGTH=330 /DNA_ID=CAMNT_0002937539 /DNA_START=1 /DNA_END=994 /DNA_ORIENTATION=-